MSIFDILAVASISTPNPSRIHYMDESGFVLCDNNHLRFCIAMYHPGYSQDIPACTPCANAYNRKLRELRRI